MPILDFVHVDVFSRTPYSGNSLPVFPEAGGLEVEEMLQITRELRHFEAIFLEPTADPGTVRTRIFDQFEELPFAGHPIIGAAAVLHARSGADDTRSWQFALPGRSVTVTTERTRQGYSGLLDQGAPEFLGEVDAPDELARGFGLTARDLRPDLPAEVVSTGLRYLIIPVQPGALARARIPHDITALLSRHRAQFAVLLDEAALEVRHWNNDGLVEDVATGSAAGTIGAYRLKHGLACPDETFVLQQGRFSGRPSQLRVRPEGPATAITTVKVGGDVVLIGSGTLHARPAMVA